MSFLRRRTRQLTPPAFAADGGATFTPDRMLPDEIAYWRCEEARLRCERLREGSAGEPERQRWHEVHREIGLAGFAASGRIPSARRRASLAFAHAQTESTSPEEDCEGLLLEFIAAAATAAVEAMLAPELALPLQQAAEHLSNARRIVLEGLRTAPAPRAALREE